MRSFNVTDRDTATRVLIALKECPELALGAIVRYALPNGSLPTKRLVTTVIAVNEIGMVLIFPAPYELPSLLTATGDKVYILGAVHISGSDAKLPMEFPDYARNCSVVTSITFQRDVILPPKP